MMSEDGFKNRNLMPEDEVDWITASDEDKLDLIIIGADSLEPGIFRGLSDKESYDIAAMAWKVCKSLNIFDRIPVFNYCIGSLFCGVRYHLDMRWGDNIEFMQDRSLSGEVRIERLNKHAWDRYMICFGPRNKIIKQASRRFVHADLSSYIPKQIDDPTEFMEGFCRIFWPEFIDIMPDHYFQRMAMPMKTFCDRNGLDSTWELALCLGAAAVCGCFFMEDPTCDDLRSMLLDKNSRLTGRDKVMNILITLQNWLGKHWNLESNE